MRIYHAHILHTTLFATTYCGRCVKHPLHQKWTRPQQEPHSIAILPDHIAVAVDLSPVQLHDPALIERIGAALVRHRLAPGRTLIPTGGNYPGQVIDDAPRLPNLTFPRSQQIPYPAVDPVIPRSLRGGLPGGVSPHIWRCPCLVQVNSLRSSNLPKR